MHISEQKLKQKLDGHWKFLRELPGGKPLSLERFKLTNFQQSETDLSRASFHGSFIWDSSFLHCTLWRVRFNDAAINSSSFQNSDLFGADFAGAVLDNVDVRGAHFTTELLCAAKLNWIICDDEQLPWLIGHPGFLRADPVQVAIARRTKEMAAERSRGF